MKFLILIFILILSCKEKKTQTVYKDISPGQNKKAATIQGNWSGEWMHIYKSRNADVREKQFTLKIIQEGNKIRGQYCAIANSGRKMDYKSEQKYNVEGYLKNGRISGTFYNFFGSPNNKGKFEISSIDPYTISWKMITPPKITAYAPKECILKKVNLTEKQGNSRISIEDRVSKDMFSRWKGNYHTNFTVTRSGEDYELSYDIKVVRQDRVLISEKINGENNNLSSVFIKSASEDQLVIKSTADDTLEYIISEIDGKYYIMGNTVYMLNPPNDRYKLTKSAL